MIPMRHHSSGAAKRKKKKDRDEDAKRNRGAMLKFLNPGCSTDRTADEVQSNSHRSLSDAESEADCDEHTLTDKEDSEAAAVEQEIQVEACNSAVQETYTDIGSWPFVITDSLRIYLVEQGFEVVQNLNDSFDDAVRIRSGECVKGSTRHLTKEWFYRKMPNGEKVLRSWLCYSPLKKALFCFCCVLFGSKKHDDAESGFSSSNGFTSWWKLNPRVSDHESSKHHVESFKAWKELGIRHNQNSTIDNQTQQAIKKEQDKWKEILTRILDIIRFLAKQNLALRGHREDENSDNKGNFLELTELLSKYDPVLREHMLKLRAGSLHTSYLSPETQNEFIQLLGSHVRKRILEKVKAAKYYAIMFDSTPDTSHIDQTSQVLRYVVCEGDSVTVQESFIDFIETKDKHADGISGMILTKLDEDGLDIKDCRGQGYDNAAVMSGKHTGVQKRISDVNPKAKFVACSNHSLNLAGLHAAHAEVGSVTFFGTLDRLYAFFSTSTHRWEKLTSVTGTTLKRNVDTRWSARGDAVKTIKTHFSEILDALEQLTGSDENNTTRSDAGLLVTAVQSFTFIAFTGFWAPILVEINDTQSYLQKKGLNVRDCANKLSALHRFLINNREDLIDGGLKFAEEKSAELGIDSEPRQRIRRKKKMPGEETRDAGLNYKDELRREMASSIDRIIVEIGTRSQQIQELCAEYEFLTPAVLLDPIAELNLENAPEEIDKEELLLERKRLQDFVAVSADRNVILQEGPLELLNFIHRYKLVDSVPNIEIALRIFLTIGVSVASCERSFSKLKLIKTYLRSTMSNLRLTNLAILSIEREITDSIDFDSIISDFANKKARKVSL